MKNIHNNLKHNYCPLCGSHQIRKQGSIKYYSKIFYSSVAVKMLITPELWKCDDCNSGFLQNAVPLEQSIELYKLGNSDGRWSTKPFEKHKTNIVVKTCENLLKKNLRVLDIGCSVGAFLDFAKLKGCVTYGVEYSQNCVNLLKEKGHIASSNIDELDGNFDIITGFDLVEHLYNVPEFLDSCLARLSPQGYLIFVTGDISCLPAKLANSNWWYVRFPEHIVFPSRKYFEHHPQLELVNWISTHAGIEYQQPVVKLIKSNIKELFILSDFTAFHTPIADHALIIMKKRN
jgi:2-polyprenyl-3-methyl-5-hydroxy-6-metoxy-1,4-benzoquinol methylase